MKKKVSVYYLYTLLCAFAVRGSLFLVSTDYKLRIDDFGPLIYPAYLAGFDWTKYYSGLNHYYGYGYYWIFAPLFKLIQNPSRLILAMALVNTFFMALICVFVYRTLVKYLYFPEGIRTVIVSVLPVFFEGDLVTEAGKHLIYRTDNEMPLFFIVWLLFGVLIRAVYHRNTHDKPSIIWSLTAALLLVWGQTVHERALAITLALICTVFLIALLKRRFVLNPAVFLGVYGVGFVIARYVRRGVINLIWAGSEGVKNLSVAPESMDVFKTWPGIKGFLVVLFGNFHALFVKSYGLVCIALFLVLGWICLAIADLIKNRSKDKEGQTSDQGLNQKDKGIEAWLVILMAFGAANLITLLGMCLRWGARLYWGMAHDAVVYSYKGICYSRYFWGILGPVILGVLIWAQGDNPLSKKLTCWIWTFFAAIEAIFLAFVFPLCLRTGGEYNYFKRALNVYFFNINLKPLNLFVTYGLTILVMILLTFRRWRAEGQQEKLTGLVGTVAVIFLCIFGLAHTNMMHTDAMKLTFSEGKPLVDMVEELGDYAGWLPEEINIVMEKRTCLYVLPLYKKELNLVQELPDNEEEPYILITDIYTNDDEMIRKTYDSHCVKIGKTYLFYTNVEEYIRCFEENGYTVYKQRPEDIDNPLGMVTDWELTDQAGEADHVDGADQVYIKDGKKES